MILKLHLFGATNLAGGQYPDPVPYASSQNVASTENPGKQFLGPLRYTVHWSTVRNVLTNFSYSLFKYDFVL